MKIGVLALQGAFREHIRVLQNLGVEAVEVRLPEDLAGADALIIPGGESTTIRKLLVEYGFVDILKKFAETGKPLFGTCAGLIVMADRVDGQRQHFLDLIDIDVSRNAYGRQVESREADVSGRALGPEPFPAVFIRAPKILGTGENVERLACYGDEVVFAREKNIFVATFHPELTGDERIHRYFLEAVKEHLKNRRNAGNGNG